MKAITTLLALGTMTSPALADAGPPKQVADLERFVGNWKGTGTFAMGKAKLQIDATWSCKRTAGNLAVECQFHVTGIPNATLDETDLLAYDAATDSYHWFAVSSFGEVHDHVAKGSIDKLEFKWSGMGMDPTNGKKVAMREVLVMEPAKDGSKIKGHTEWYVGNTLMGGIDLEVRK